MMEGAEGATDTLPSLARPSPERVILKANRRKSDNGVCKTRFIFFFLF